jgi:hypothetical protein
MYPDTIRARYRPPTPGPDGPPTRAERVLMTALAAFVVVYALAYPTVALAALTVLAAAAVVPVATTVVVVAISKMVTRLERYDRPRPVDRARTAATRSSTASRE